MKNGNGKHKHPLTKIKPSLARRWAKQHEEPEPFAPRRHVDFFTEQSDFEVALLGSLGFGTDYIAAKTGLSAGQVVYRLHKAHVKRSDYRAGTSPVARAMLQNAKRLSAPLVRRELQDQFNEFAS